MRHFLYYQKKIKSNNVDNFLFRKCSPKTFSRIVAESGLNDGVTDRIHKVVFHTLRHTFASWLIQKGVALEVVSKLLGHNSLQMTMRYAHLDPVKQAMKAVMSIEL